MRGINFVEYCHLNDGDYRGKWADYALFFGIVDYNNRYSWSNATVEKKHDGRHDWTWDKLDVSHLNGDYYLRFQAENGGHALDNSGAHLSDNLYLHWKNYNFEQCNAQQFFKRYEYDFDKANGTKEQIKYDNGSYDYNPGEVYFANTNGQKVDGFYANTGGKIHVVEENAALNKQYGIELEGVYFMSKDTNKFFEQGTNDEPGVGKWSTTGAYYMTASQLGLGTTNGGFVPNQSFLQSLQSDSSKINVIPRYRQKKVTLSVYNDDLPAQRSNYKKGTYIVNLANDNYIQKLSTGAVYHKWTFPINSKIKARMITAAGRAPAQFKINEVNKVNEQDLSTIEFALSQDTKIYPQTKIQDFKVLKNPASDTKNPLVINEQTGRYEELKDYKGRVVERGFLGSGAQLDTSDSNGTIVKKDITNGQYWSYFALPPQGYYTEWINGTGDTNNNGMIDNRETTGLTDIQEKEGGYFALYGNVISGNVVQDNMKFYYRFKEGIMKDGKEREGTLYKDNRSFYDITNRVSASSANRVVVPNAYVQFSDSLGMTNEKGRYNIKINNIPSTGHISVLVTKDGKQYVSKVSITYEGNITLPAYECFEPESISATYASKKSSINKKNITVEDDTITLTAKVKSNGNLQAEGAEFYIYDQKGILKEKCSGNSSKYTINTGNGRASLSFNAKSVLSSGDRVFVAFKDQYDVEYAPIDLGYTFIRALALTEFVLPMIGSSLLSDIATYDYPIIGNPLNDLDIGLISGIKVSSPTEVNPVGNYKYIQYDYQYGDYNEAIKSFSSKKTPSATEAPDKIKDSVKDTGKTPGKSKLDTKSSFSWNVNLKMVFNLRITSREVNGQRKNYFEELDFVVGAGFGANASLTITLPIGMSVIVSGSINGDITAIYQMKMNYYGDSTWDKNKVEYSADTFGIFKDIDNVDRYGYLLLNPDITIGLGISFAVIEVGGHANFKFDMDFKFGNRVDAYGDMKINFDYYVEVLSFKVYEQSTKDTTVKLFSTDGVTGHIDPDLAISLSSMETTSISNTQSSRAYLENRSEWNDGGVQLFRAANEHTTETTLLNGSAPSIRSQIAKLDDNKLLMVFINDDPERSDINRSAIYYSIYENDTWGEAKIIDDDGTIDNYPNVFDLGDKVLISWSSADSVLKDDKTVEEALSSLDIKVVLFDKNTQSFGEIDQITHKTESDFTSDTYPKAAYDSDTDRLILYYTKTEYSDNLSDVGDIVNADSVIAYRFYEDGKWVNDYTPEELENISDPAKYTEDWYGQRFLDVRIDKNSPDMLRIVESDAAYYNGLALYTFVVDHDKDLNTVDDRDVFMQIYNFEDNEFHHLIKMTNETGKYASPSFARDGNNTYLFFASDEYQDTDDGSIVYLDVSDIVKNDKLKLVDGTNPYYILQYDYVIPAYTGSEGEAIEATTETITVEPTIAVITEGFANDFNVNEDEDGSIYVVWTDNIIESNSRQIFAAVCTLALEPEEKGESETEEIATGWSDKFMITTEENAYYTNIGSSVIDGNIYLVGNKAKYIQTEAGMQVDRNSSKIVSLKHIPYSEIVSGEITFDKLYVIPNEMFTVTSSVKNNGLRPINTKVQFEFLMKTGDEITSIGTREVERNWFGGSDLTASMEFPSLDTIPDDLEIIVNINNGETQFTQNKQIVKQASIFAENESIRNIAKENALDIDIRNVGNLEAQDVLVKVYFADDEGKAGEDISTFTIEKIEPNTVESISEIIKIEDDKYNIEEGVGTANIILEVLYGDEVVKTSDHIVERVFDKDAIDAISKVESVKVESDKIQIRKGKTQETGVSILGDDAQEFNTIVWSSSNDEVAYVNSEGNICAVSSGTAVLTGAVTPKIENIVFNSDGIAQTENVLDNIPETMQKTVSLNVTVRSGTSGGGSSQPEPTATPTSEPTLEPTAKPTATPDIKDDIFTDVSKSHWAYQYITNLAQDNIVKGMGDGTFLPDGNVTRAQFAKMLYETNLVKNEEMYDSILFSDVSADSWYAPYIDWAVRNGIVKGMGDGTFLPKDNVTREQMAVMVIAFIERTEIEFPETVEVNYNDENEISEWARNEVLQSSKIGILHGYEYGSFKPQGLFTRAEAATVICNIIYK